MFDLDMLKVTSVIEMNDDGVECVSLVPGQPFIMLGIALMDILVVFLAACF